MGFEGLKKEHDQLIEKSSARSSITSKPGCSRCTENYEIAAYEVSVGWRRPFGEDEAVVLLDANLKQKEALREVEEDRDPAKQRVDVRIGDEIGQRLSDLVPHQSELARSLGVHCRVKAPTLAVAHCS